LFNPIESHSAIARFAKYNGRTWMHRRAGGFFHFGVQFQQVSTHDILETKNIEEDRRGIRFRPTIDSSIHLPGSSNQFYRVYPSKGRKTSAA